MFEPGVLYLVTARTIHGRFLMAPHRGRDALIGGVVARALHLYREVRLYNIVTMSNHLHMIVSAPPEQISRFVGYVSSNIARTVGPRVDWRQKFWGTRFRAQPILDDEALEGLMAYLWAHGAKEGLVEEGKLWPGLQCIADLLNQKDRLYAWLDRTALFWARRKRKAKSPPLKEAKRKAKGKGKVKAIPEAIPVKESDFTHYYPLRLSPLPHYEGLSTRDRKKAYQHIYAKACELAEKKREGKKPLGQPFVEQQDPHDSPRAFKKKNQPICHSACPVRKERYRESYAGFIAAYQAASVRFRNGQVAVFPRFAFRPPLPFDWKPNRQGPLGGAGPPNA